MLNPTLINTYFHLFFILISKAMKLANRREKLKGEINENDKLFGSSDK